MCIIMSLNEKLEDLNYVDRNEWFEVIKDVCRSQSKRAVGFLAVVLLLFILAGIYSFTSKSQGHEVGDIAVICFDLIICFVLGSSGLRTASAHHNSCCSSMKKG